MIEQSQYKVVIFGKGWEPEFKGLSFDGVIRFIFTKFEHIPSVFIEVADYVVEKNEKGTIVFHKNRYEITLHAFVEKYLSDPVKEKRPTLADLADSLEEVPWSGKPIIVHQKPHTCEHLNVLNPNSTSDPELRVLWCRDCGALLMPGGTIILPGAE